MRIGIAAVLAGLLLLLALPGLASAHGDESGATTPSKPGMSAEEAEVAALAEQPARVLAQQALAQLQVSGDRHEAAVRLDAALESKDKSDVDLAVLRRATETLDGGDPEGAVPLIDEALSRPLGSDSGKALHEAGREFRPATGAQEIVGIVLGGLLLLLGAALLLRGRSRAPHVPPAHGSP